MMSKRGCFVRILIFILVCLLALVTAIVTPRLFLHFADVRRDYGIRGIALADGNNANAYIYVTESELTRYRDTTDFWITRSDNSYKVHQATLVQISSEPVSKASLYEKFGSNPEIEKILPLEDCYELQVAFDRTLYRWDTHPNDPYLAYRYKEPLDWITEEGIEYALCTVYCKGISVGSAYDHIFGKYAKAEGYLDLN